MTDYSVKSGAVEWQRLEGFDHLSYNVLNVDRDAQIVDVMFRFDANQRIALHRHVALNHMLVLEGNHHLYDPSGNLKEVRPTGRYTISPPDDEPHFEGGGEADVIILFSIRGTDNVMYEFIDEKGDVALTFGMDEFEGLYLQQQAA